MLKFNRPPILMPGLGLVFAAALGGCGTGAPHRPEPATASIPVVEHFATRRIATPPANMVAALSDSTADKSASPNQAKLFRGSGTLVKPASRDTSSAPAAGATGDDVSLNFEAADVREVVKNILTDILNEGYIFDPAVQGSVTLRTTRPIPRRDLLATLETILRMNGAALVKEAGVFRVVPVANAFRGVLTPQLGAQGQPIPQGFSVRLVPLKYIGVREMARILDPFVKDAASMRADDLRNMLILFGTEREILHLVNIIEMFDLDWMSGMSVGLFTLQSAEVKAVSAELDKILGDKNLGPLAGLLRIIPIERLNALLIITPQPHYLEQAKVWIERLDRGGDSGGTRLFVYQVRNGRADKLAPLLTQAFTGRAPTSAAPSAPTLAPGQTPATIASAPPGQQPAPAPASGPPAAGSGLAIARNVTIIADKDNNALLIMATPSEYSLLEAAVKRLDVAPRQVMIEVTIAEVILTDDLSLGLQGYFTDSPYFSGSLLTGAATSLGTATPGFSYLWKPGGTLGALAPNGIAGMFQMLAKDSRVNIISRPNIMATDNQKAQIQVGDRVPTTSQTQTVSGTTTGIINSVQYLDTGILLNVTPHINDGGLVTLELNTEVSSANKTETSSIDSPTITKRSAQTSVTVQSGDTMVMGGLIREDKSNGSSGLPLISQIPVLGALFGSQTRNSKRTELVIFITPKLVTDGHQLKAVTEELRNKMEYLGKLIPESRKPQAAGRDLIQDAGAK